MNSLELFRLLEVMLEKHYETIMYSSVSKDSDGRINIRSYLEDPSKIIQVSDTQLIDENRLLYLVGDIAFVDCAKDLLSSESYLGCIISALDVYCFAKHGMIYLLRIRGEQRAVRTLTDDGDRNIKSICKKATVQYGNYEFDAKVLSLVGVIDNVNGLRMKFFKSESTNKYTIDEFINSTGFVRIKSARN